MLSTCDRGDLAGLVAVAVLLPVSILFGVLQAQLVADLERLPHRPHDPHGLALETGRRGEGERLACIQQSSNLTGGALLMEKVMVLIQRGHRSCQKKRFVFFVP